MRLLWTLNFLSALFSSTTWAAACCGGGSALPAVITSDDKAQFSISLSHKENLTEVYPNGVWAHRQDTDITETQTLNYAHIFWDRYQWGLSIPIQNRRNSRSESGSNQGLGDVSAQVGYEYLPDWDYHPWRPKGIGFLAVSLPTGRSIHESNDPSSVTAHGRGYSTLSLGTSLTKNFTEWDCIAIIEAHHGLQRQISRSVSNGEETVTMSPGFGSTVSAGAGYNWNAARLGILASSTYEDAVAIRTASATAEMTSDGSASRVSDLSLVMSYLFLQEWSGSITLSDQSLLGDPSSTSLGKSVAISFNKRWTR